MEYKLIERGRRFSYKLQSLSMLYPDDSVKELERPLFQHLAWLLAFHLVPSLKALSHHQRSGYRQQKGIRWESLAICFLQKLRQAGDIPTVKGVTRWWFQWWHSRKINWVGNWSLVIDYEQSWLWFRTFGVSVIEQYACEDLSSDSILVVYDGN